jgi:hypothetical protein
MDGELMISLQRWAVWFEDVNDKRDASEARDAWTKATAFAVAATGACSRPPVASGLLNVVSLTWEKSKTAAIVVQFHSEGGLTYKVIEGRDTSCVVPRTVQEAFDAVTRWTVSHEW